MFWWHCHSVLKWGFFIQKNPHVDCFTICDKIIFITQKTVYMPLVIELVPDRYRIPVPESPLVIELVPDRYRIPVL